MTTSRLPRRRRLAPALLLASVLLLAACGGGDAPGTDGDPGATGTAAGAAAGACLEGAEDCDDVPTGTGGVQSQPDGSVAVADAVATPIDGPFVVSGYWYDDGSGPRLCEALAESFPPQCGGASMPVEGATPPEGLQSEGEVQWSEEPTSIDGQVVDGVFVAASR